MSQLIEGFNPLDYDPQQGEGQLPVGKQPVAITAAEVKATKGGDSGMLVLTLTVLDGPNKGATGPYRLNLYHGNQQTVEIAKKQLSAVCHVTGIFQLGQNGTDLTPLFNIPFIVDVGVQVQDDRYTEIKKIFDIHGNEPKRQGGSNQQQQQVQQNNNPNGGFNGGGGNFQQNNQAANGATAPANTAGWQNGNASAAQPQQQQNNWQQNNQQQQVQQVQQNQPTGAAPAWAKK